MVDLVNLGFRVDSRELVEADKRMDALDESGKRVESRSRGLTTGFSTFAKAAATAAGALGLGAMVATSRDFEASMNDVEEKLGGTESQMEMLRKKALEMGASTAFSASQSADAMSSLAAKGLDTTKIIGVLPDVMNLASAAQLTLEQSAKLTTATMNQFNLGVEESTRVVDLLAAVGDSSGATIYGLEASLKKAGPAAHAYGVSLESTAAAIAILANNSIEAEVAGTAIAGMFSKLMVATGDGEKALAKYNLTSADFIKIGADGSEQFIGYADAIELLSDAQVTATDISRIFGLEAGKNLVPLVAAGADSIREMERSFDDASSAIEQANTQMKGLPGSWKNTTSAWEGFQLALMGAGGTGLAIKSLDALTAALRIATAFINDAADIVGVQWARFKDAITLDANETPTTLTRIADAVRSIGNYLTPLIPYLDDFAIAVVGVGALLTSPITLTVTAVAGLAVAAHELYQNWGSVKQWWSDMWSGMKDDASALLTWWQGTTFEEKTLDVIDISVGLAETAVNKLFNLWNNSELKKIAPEFVVDGIAFAEVAANRFFNWWNTTTINQKILQIKDTGIKAAQGITTAFISWWNSATLKKHALNVVNSSVTMSEGVVKNLFALWNNSTLKTIAPKFVVDSLTKAESLASGFFSWWNGSTLNQKIATVKAEGIQAAQTAYQTLINWWNRPLREKVLSIVDKGVQGAASVTTSFFNLWNNTRLKKIAPQFVVDGITFAETAATRFFDWWNSTSLESKAFDIKTAAIDTAKTLAQSFSSWWNRSTLKEKELALDTFLLETAHDLALSFVDWWNRSKLKELTPSIVTDSITDAFGAIVDFNIYWRETSLKEIAADVSFELVTMALDAIDKLVKFWNGIKLKVIDLEINMPEIFTNPGSVIDKAKTLGGDIGQGLTLGIAEKAATAKKTLADIATGAIQGAKDAVQSRSPSRLTMQLGNDIADGLVIGIKQRLNNILDAGEQMSAASIKAFDDIKKSLAEKLVGLRDGERALRQYQLSQKGLNGEAVKTVMALEDEVKSLEEKRRVTERIGREMGDLAKAQRLQNIELTQGVAAAEKADLTMRGYSDAQAENKITTERNMETQRKFHGALVDSIKGAESVKDVIKNLGDFLKDWLKEKIAHFAANKILAYVGMGGGGVGVLNSLLGGLGGGGGGLSGTGGGGADSGQAANGGAGVGLEQLLLSAGIGFQVGGLIQGGNSEMSGNLGGAGAAVGMALGGPLGAAVGTALGAALGGAFSTKWAETSKGFEAGYQAGEIVGHDFSISERERSWFRGTQIRETLSELDSDVSNQLSKFFETMENTITTQAAALGVAGADSILDSFEVATQRFTGANAEADLQKWLEDSTRKAYQHAFANLGTELQDYIANSVDLEGGSIEEISAVFDKIAQAAALMVPSLEAVGLELTGSTQENAAVAVKLADSMDGVGNAMQALSLYAEEFVPESDRVHVAMNANLASLAAWNDQVGDTHHFDLANAGLQGFRDQVVREYQVMYGTEALQYLNVAGEAMRQQSQSLNMYTRELDISTDSGRLAVDQVHAFTTSIDLATGKLGVNDVALFNYIDSLDRTTVAGQDAYNSAMLLADSLGVTSDSTINTRQEMYNYIDGLDLTTEAGQNAYAAAMQNLDAIIATEDAHLRQIATLNTVSDAANTLNLNFDQTSPMALRASEALVELMGGFDQFGAATNSYYNDFYTAKEREQIELANSAIAVENFNNVLELNGMTAITTGDQFRAYVESLDLTTEAGRQAFAAAMDVSSAMFAVSESGQSVDEIMSQMPENLRGSFQEMTDVSQQAATRMQELNAIMSGSNLSATQLMVDNNSEAAASLEAFAETINTETQAGLNAYEAVTAQIMALNVDSANTIQGIESNSANQSISTAQQIAAQAQTTRDQLLAYADSLDTSTQAGHAAHAAVMQQVNSLQNLTPATNSASNSISGLTSKVGTFGNQAQTAARAIVSSGGSIANALREAERIQSKVDYWERAARRVHGTHALGLDYVPFDGYIAELHKGERVLTNEENKQLMDRPVFSSVNLTKIQTASNDDRHVVVELQRIRQELENIKDNNTRSAGSNDELLLRIGNENGRQTAALREGNNIQNRGYRRERKR